MMSRMKFEGPATISPGAATGGCNSEFDVFIRYSRSLRVTVSTTFARKMGCVAEDRVICERFSSRYQGKIQGYTVWPQIVGANFHEKRRFFQFCRLSQGKYQGK